MMSESEPRQMVRDDLAERMQPVCTGNGESPLGLKVFVVAALGWVPVVAVVSAVFGR